MYAVKAVLENSQYQEILIKLNTQKPSSHFCNVHLNLKESLSWKLEQKDMILLYDKLVEYVPGA